MGRRLGYPLKFARTSHHLFARWEEQGGERFNIECTSRGLDTPTDEYYLTWPELVLPHRIWEGLYLQSMTPRQELAGWLIQRSVCLQDNRRYREAAEACVGACLAAPEVKLHEYSLIRALRAWRGELDKRMPPAFPQVVARWSGEQPSSSGVSRELERTVLELETTERLLADPGNEQKWWRFLRPAPREWPRHVPKRVEFIKRGCGWFMPEGATA